MIYLIHSHNTCGLAVTDEAPIFPEASFSDFLISMTFTDDPCFVELDTDLAGLSGLLCDGEALKALGVDNSNIQFQVNIERVHSFVSNLLKGCGCE